MIQKKYNNRDLFDFINTHLTDDPNSLLMKYKGKTFNFDLNFAIDQIINRKKGKKKLSSFPHQSLMSRHLMKGWLDFMQA